MIITLDYVTSYYREAGDNNNIDRRWKNEKRTESDGNDV